MERIVTVIVDDHKLFAHGLANLLKSSEELKIAAILHDGYSLLEYLKHEEVDVLLIDLNMPQMDGFTVIEHIKSAAYQTKLIVLSTYADQKLVNQAIELGVDAYLLKDAEPEELIYTIKEVMEARYNFNIQHILKQTEGLLHFSNDFLKKHQLSKREIEIIQLVKAGLKNQEIADKLFLSILTIQTHRKNIISKLAVENTAGLINFAHQNQI